MHIEVECQEKELELKKKQYKYRKATICNKQKDREDFYLRVQLYFEAVLCLHDSLCCLVYGFHNHFGATTDVHPILWSHQYCVCRKNKQVGKIISI